MQPPLEAPGSELDELERLERRFAEVHGPGATPRRFFSPGRVNLMGAHLDYNGGPVMPVALDRGTIIMLRPRSDDRLELASTLEPGGLSTCLSDLPRAPSGRWYDYPLGVIVRMLRDGDSHVGADVLFGGNLPIGAGLSSSASICVGTAFAFRALWGRPDDPLACIEAALWGEREWVGVQCGIMDPYAVALSRPGHVLWVECRDRAYEHLPLDGTDLLVSIVDTGIRRELAKGDFNLRVSECGQALERLRAQGERAAVLSEVPPEAVASAAGDLGPVLTLRARHVVEEMARTRAARMALLDGDVEALGRCISATHASLRDLYEVSVPELDCLVDAAIAVPGVLGSRLTGAGFGGCVLVLLRAEAREAFSEGVRDAFERRFGRRPPLFFFQSGGGPREYV